MCQPLLDRLLAIGRAPAQATLELLLGRRRDEHVARRELGGLDLLHPLHLNVQHHDLSLGGLLLDRRLARAVVVAAELGAAGAGSGQRVNYGGWAGEGALPLDEPVVGLEGEKLVLGDKVVVHAMLLAGAWVAGGVRDGQRKGVGVAVEEQPVEGALSDAGRAGDDDGLPLRREGRHSGGEVGGAGKDAEE